MLEKEIQSKIIRYLKTIKNGYVIKNNAAGRYSSQGVPDITFIASRKAYFFEVKQPGKVATKLQQHNIDRLNQAGAIACVVTSLDEVKEVLKI